MKAIARNKSCRWMLTTLLTLVLVLSFVGYSVSMPNIVEAYTGTLRDSFTSYANYVSWGTYYYAQTFVATATYTLTEVDWYGDANGLATGNITMSVRLADHTGNSSHPTGADLDTSLREITDFPGAGGGFLTFTFAGGVTIINGETYSIITRVTNQDNPNVQHVKNHTVFFPNYTGGVASRSSDNGTSWTIWDATADFPFYVYGTDIPITPIVSAGTTQVEGWNRAFYANGRYWVWYNSVAGISYKTTDDEGITYSAAVDVTTRESECWQVWFNGTRVYYTKVDDTAKNKNIYWRFGVCNADGTITWGIAESVIVAADAAYYYRWVTPVVTSSGEVVVAYTRCTSYSFPKTVTGDVRVAISTTAIGAWVDKAGFPATLDSFVASKAKVLSLIPTTGGKAYLSYTLDSLNAKGIEYNASFGSIETIASDLYTISTGAILRTVYDAGNSRIVSAYAGTSGNLKWASRTGTTWTSGGDVYNDWSDPHDTLAADQNGSMGLTTLLDGTLWCFWRERRSSPNFFDNFFALSGYPAHYSAVTQLVGNTWYVPTTYTIGNAPGITGNGGIMYGLQAGAPTLVQITDGYAVPYMLYAYFAEASTVYKAPYVPWVNFEYIIDNSTATTATLKGTLLHMGFGETSVTCGFEYGLDNTTTSTSATVTCTTDGEEFSIEITGLTANTLYYYRAFATNSYGTAYSDMLRGLSPPSFTTPISASTPRIIGGTPQLSTGGSRRSGLVYANGRYWAFCSSRVGFNIVGESTYLDITYAYTSSEDASDWDAWTIINGETTRFKTGSPLTTTGDYKLHDFDYSEITNKIWAVGVAEGNDAWVLSATPNSAGYLEDIYIKFGIYVSTGVSETEIKIRADNNGYPWISLADENTGKMMIVKSSTNDGTWVTEAGFPYQDTDGKASIYLCDYLAPVSEGMAIAGDNTTGIVYVKIYNVSTDVWSTKEYPFGTSDNVWITGMSSFPDGTLFVSGCPNGGDFEIRVSVRDPYGIWTETEIAHTTAGADTDLCSGTSATYLFWSEDPVAQHYYYSRYDGTTWGAVTDWQDLSAIASYESAGSYGIHLNTQPKSISNSLFVLCFPVFTTTVYSNQMSIVEIVEDPVYLTALSSGGTVELAWEKGFGDVDVLVRYSNSHYPVSITDGTEVYDGDADACDMAVIGGSTYYFSIWGRGGTTYSDNYETALITTSATGGDAGADTVVDGTGYPHDDALDSSFLRGFVDFMEDYSGLPRGTVGLSGFAAIVIFALVGVAAYNKSVLLTLILAVVGMGIGGDLGVLSPIFAVSMAIIGAAIGVIRGGQPTGG